MLLAGSLPSLDGVTYQAKLGSIGDKVRRNTTLALKIADALGIEGTETDQKLS